LAEAEVRFAYPTEIGSNHSGGFHVVVAVVAAVAAAVAAAVVITAVVITAVVITAVVITAVVITAVVITVVVAVHCYKVASGSCFVSLKKWVRIWGKSVPEEKKKLLVFHLFSRKRPITHSSRPHIGPKRYRVTQYCS
jgi:hypothetical protein